jgi:lipase maturation factor 1
MTMKGGNRDCSTMYSERMDLRPAGVFRWLFDSKRGAADRLLVRWLFLRGFGLIYFSAFFALLFQIRGLLGARGLLPASEYLRQVASSTGAGRFWYAPSLLWVSSSSHMLMGLCWVGLVASVLVVVNFWPRAMLVICFVCFLSFVTAASDFSGYQSDGMLLEAGFIALFLAPPGLRPGLGRKNPPMRASIFLLVWEWFRIYFESGVVKLASGDPEWRHLTAMDEYYQNGPLPTWIGWYVQHFPHWFHEGTALLTLVLELGLAWMGFLPRRWRIVCFFIVTPWQIGVILTANYTFLNYLVLLLGIFLLDDRFVAQFAPPRWREAFLREKSAELTDAERGAFEGQSILGKTGDTGEGIGQPTRAQSGAREIISRQVGFLKLALTTVILGWLFYASTAPMILMLWREAPLPMSPVAALEPFRVADRYGLFAVMTRGRYEIEFQGSNDGQNWLTYPFRFKPQDPYKAPGIYAPYQPRFEWNLWFASLGTWRSNVFVPRAEVRLLEGSKDVLALFAGNPFPQGPPREVRAVIWQYWFSSREEKREQGIWWTRKWLGLYAPTLERENDGRIVAVAWPTDLEPRE